MQWYYGIGNEVGGPVENDDLVVLVRTGNVRPETLVWASYLGNWTPAGRIDGLFAAAGISGFPAPVPQGNPGGGAVYGGRIAVAVAAPVPRIQTERLGLTAVPRRETAGIPNGGDVALNTAGVALNPSGVALAPNLATGSPLAERAEVPSSPVGLQSPETTTSPGLAQPGGALLNPYGIPVPEAGNPASSSRGGTFVEGGIPEPVEEGFKLLKPSVGGAKVGASDFAPARKAASVTGGGWKKWAIPGLAALVLLAGGAALADKFLLGGKLFGFGARPTGPYCYYPDAPRFVFNVEVRGLLLNPVVSGKLEEGGGMSMIDQMMHSAVGLRPYDIEDVKVVGADLSLAAPRFVCIVKTSKKIPEEMLVEKFFGDEKPTRVCGRNIYNLPMVGSGRAVACIADETTVLLGGREEIKAVLERTAEPEFSEEEMSLIRAAEESSALFSMSADAGLLKDLKTLAAGVPGAGAQADFFAGENMESAQMMSVSVDVQSDFETTYRIEFDTEESAKAAFDRTQKQLGGGSGGGAGQSEILKQFAEQFPDQAAGAKALSFDCKLEGKTMIVTMAIPMALFEQMIGQGMGAAGAL